MGCQLTENILYYGDNLKVLRNEFPDKQIDLVYLDPPFNSNKDYNQIFGTKQQISSAQIKGFRRHLVLGQRCRKAIPRNREIFWE